MGKPRCQRWAIRDGVFWQCPHAARDGCNTCGSHGAGYPKREREGRRKNPVTAAVKSGERARPDTIRQLYESNPEFRALYQIELGRDDILDFREELALARSLARWFVDRAKLQDMDNSFGKTPPALLAIDRLERVMSMGERCLKIEASLGAISHEQLRYYFRVVADCLDRFVPANQTDSARAYLAERLRRRDTDGVAIQDGGGE